MSSAAAIIRGLNAGSTFAGGFARTAMMLERQDELKSQWEQQFAVLKGNAKRSYELSLRNFAFQQEKWEEGAKARNLTYDTAKVTHDVSQYAFAHKKKSDDDTIKAKSYVMQSLLGEREDEDNIVFEALGEWPEARLEELEWMLKLHSGSLLGGAGYKPAWKEVETFTVEGMDYMKWVDLNATPNSRGSTRVVPTHDAKAVREVVDGLYKRFREKKADVFKTLDLAEKIRKSGMNINIGVESGDAAERLKRDIKLMSQIDATASLGYDEVRAEWTQALNSFYRDKKGKVNKELLNSFVEMHIGLKPIVPEGITPEQAFIGLAVKFDQASESEKNPTVVLTSILNEILQDAAPGEKEILMDAYEEFKRSIGIEEDEDFFQAELGVLQTWVGMDLSAEGRWRYGVKATDWANKPASSFGKMLPEPFSSIYKGLPGIGGALKGAEEWLRGEAP